MTGSLRYPGAVANRAPDTRAIVMAGSAQEMTYGEVDAFAWRASRAFRSLGLTSGDHVAFLLENRLEYPAIHWGAHYAGLYYTFISTHLTPSEVAYIAQDCGAAVVIVSAVTAAGNVEALRELADPPAIMSLGQPVDRVEPFEMLLAGQPAHPLQDAVEGCEMLYSSGTTGRPRGVKPPLSGAQLGTTLLVADMGAAVFELGPDSVYLSPAPHYHAAPQGWVRAVTGLGGTAVMMEKFDAEAALRAIEAYRVTHSQWVPTMFKRLLRLPDEVKARYNLTSHRVAVHAAAPCPPAVKRAMIEWWGPILHEYYAGTEAIGMTHCNTEQWLSHPGTVGHAIYGKVSILDGEGNPLPAGEEGTIAFTGGRAFRYHGDDTKTAEAYVADGTATMGDVGRIDEDGFLYLTDRKANMIISGGVNIYPQEVEDLLQSHPKVLDVAVIGVPNEDFGEEVLAIVQPAQEAADDVVLETELIELCKHRLSSIKCPRRIEFRTELPRTPTGKLLKRTLRDEYWAGRESRLV
jgi:long-chain acyl-CoA synthetase